MLMIVLVLAFIFTALAPLVYSTTMHLVSQPITFIFSVIAPYVSTKASYFIVYPVSFEIASIVPSILTLSILFTLGVLSLIFISIRPRLSSKSMLTIFQPVSLISTTGMVDENTITVSLSILPTAFINVAIRINKFAFAICLVFMPIALIYRTIWPSLNSMPLFLISQPTSMIGYTTFKSYKPSLDNLIAICVFDWLGFYETALNILLIIDLVGRRIIIEVIHPAVFFALSISYSSYSWFLRLVLMSYYFCCSIVLQFRNLFSFESLLHCQQVLPILLKLYLKILVQQQINKLS